MKNDCIAYVLDQLNSFHEGIQFIYEVEHNNKLLFLDVLFIKTEAKWAQQFTGNLHTLILS